MSADLSDQIPLPGITTPNNPESRSETSSDDGNRHRDSYECPRCGGWWQGLRTCHCTACHQTFTSITAFDEHRTGSHALDTRHCIPPTKAGLVDAYRAYPCWAVNDTDNRWDTPDDS